jgi:uncharacterized protein (TIGR02569 family)
MSSISAQEAPPPSDVLEAFGLNDRPEPLSGGQDPVWRVGRTVLKRLDLPAAQLEWQAQLFDGLQERPDFRVPRAIRSVDGPLEYKGWFGMTFLPGRREPGRWLDIIDVGRLFHDSVSSVSKPAFLLDRDDPWSVGDRIAWAEMTIDEIPVTKHLERLTSILRPVTATPQLIHGDLTGNVLFDDDLPPVILDLSPYFRPPRFADAVVVADALVWEGGDPSLVDAVEDPEFPQYLVRALIYRAVTDRLFRRDQPFREDAEDPYLPAVDLVVSVAER